MLPLNKTVGGTKGTVCFAFVISVLIFTSSEESVYSFILKINLDIG